MFVIGTFVKKQSSCKFLPARQFTQYKTLKKVPNDKIFLHMVPEIIENTIQDYRCLPIELGKEIFITNVSQQPHHLETSHNTY